MYIPSKEKPTSLRPNAKFLRNKLTKLGSDAQLLINQQWPQLGKCAVIETMLFSPPINCNLGAEPHCAKWPTGATHLLLTEKGKLPENKEIGYLKWDT